MHLYQEEWILQTASCPSGSGAAGDWEFAATEGEEALQDVHQMGQDSWAHLLHQNRDSNSKSSDAKLSLNYVQASMNDFAFKLYREGIVLETWFCLGRYLSIIDVNDMSELREFEWRLNDGEEESVDTVGLTAHKLHPMHAILKPRKLA
ncbi:hypothetical protein TIFTF001_005246 [Ficus carica]|uniref:Uncharacterized protein n=1 Tax=Ficus carica TaxID=3494 RepID=A0AA88CUG5_FICCA|nr:hypothetical protein TIFTF001_005246 [Ficus carica]